METRVRTKFISIYKFDSVFIKTFFVLILLTIFMMTIFYLLTTRLVYDNLKEKTKTANLALLTKTGDSLDLSFSYLSQMMNNLMWDKNVSGYIVAPGMNNYERNASVAQLISNTPMNNKLINRAFLYVPFNETVVTSSGTIVKKDHFYDSKVIEEYLKGFSNMGVVETEEFSTKIKAVDGRILLFQDFPRSLRIATLVFELNSEKLYEIVQGTETYRNQSIYIYDSGDEPVFTTLLNYPSIKTAASQNTLVFRGDRVNTGNEDSQRVAVLSHQSKKTGWKYFYVLNKKDINLDYSTVVGFVLPSMVFFFIVSLVFSLYISYNIYAPINDLMRSITNVKGNSSAGRKSEAKDEFDFIKLAYANSLDKSTHLIGLMESVSPAIIDKLFANLLSGKDTEEKMIRETLESIGNPYDPDGRYVVLISQLKYPSSTAPSAVEKKLYNISITRIIHSFMEDKCRCYSKETEDDTQIHILGFTAGEAAVNIKRTLFLFYKSMEEQMQSLPYDVILGQGEIYNGIFKIRHSFVDAQKDLSYRLYYGSKNEKARGEQEDGQSSGLSALYYYRERTSQIIQAVADGNYNQKAQLQSIIHEVGEMISEFDTAKQIYESIIDTVIAKMISMRISPDEMIFTEKKYLNKDVDACANIQQMQEYTDSFCRQAIEIIDIYGKKGRHKYIEQAKEYIASNYSDSSLSRNKVGEYIGINPSYLSHLFNDNLNQKFIDYLNFYRVEKAKQLLDATNLTIADVGFKTGFNSSQNFIRVFKKHTGFTPGQYREKAGKDVFEGFSLST